jgi:hypothetical protein
LKVSKRCPDALQLHFLKEGNFDGADDVEVDAGNLREISLFPLQMKMVKE